MKRLLLILILTFCCSCSVLKAGPAVNAGFLPFPKMLKEMRSRAPFHGYWVHHQQKYYDLKQQHPNIYIAPINTEILAQKILVSDKSDDTKIHLIEEAQEIAEYFRNILMMSLKKKAGKKYQVISTPEENSFILKLAIVELKPNSPGINILGTVAGFFFPGGGLVSQFGAGNIAIEGYVVLSSNPEVLFEQFKDREVPKNYPFSIKDYQRYAHIRLIVDEWSDQITELYLSQPQHMVDDELPLSLNPF